MRSRCATPSRRRSCARAGGGATLIEARTERLAGHLAHDKQGYRPAGELAAAWDRCPIRLLRQDLSARGRLGDDGFARLQSEVDAEVAAAVAFARSSPFPEPREAFEDLWA